MEVSFLDSRKYIDMQRTRSIAAECWKGQGTYAKSVCYS